MITVKKNAIRYKTSEGMQDSGVLANVGVVQNMLDYVKVYARLFFGTVFPSGTKLNWTLATLTDGTASSSAISFINVFQNSTGLESLKLNAFVNNRKVNISEAFRELTIKEIDFTDFNLEIYQANYTFQYCADLEAIKGEIKFSEDVTSITNMFYGCSKLREIRFAKNTIKISLNMAQSSLLSDSSVQSIIDGLADLTSGTSKTLTLHKDVKAKLTEAQIATITSKNWTLA